MCEAGDASPENYLFFATPFFFLLPHRDTTVKLGRKAEDLEDVRYLVNVLDEVRGRQPQGLPAYGSALVCATPLWHLAFNSHFNCCFT